MLIRTILPAKAPLIFAGIKFIDGVGHAFAEILLLLPKGPRRQDDAEADHADHEVELVAVHFPTHLGRVCQTGSRNKRGYTQQEQQAKGLRTNP